MVFGISSGAFRRGTPRGRRLAALPAVALLVAVAGCGNHATSNAGAPSTSPSASSQASGTPGSKGSQASSGHSAPPTVAVPAKVRVAAVHTATSSLVATVGLLAHPETAAQQDGVSLRGRALKAVLAQRDEYADKHLHVVGTPKVLHSRVIAHNPKSGRLVLSVCVDNSAVHVLDKHGNRVSGPPSATHVHNVFTLMPRPGGGLAVVNVGFAENPVC